MLALVSEDLSRPVDCCQAFGIEGWLRATIPAHSEIRDNGVDDGDPVVDDCDCDPYMSYRSGSP